MSAPFKVHLCDEGDDGKGSCWNLFLVSLCFNVWRSEGMIYSLHRQAV